VIDEESKMLEKLLRELEILEKFADEQEIKARKARDEAEIRARKARSEAVARRIIAEAYQGAARTETELSARLDYLDTVLAAWVKTLLGRHNRHLK
jgi:uncharacterized membrane protein YqiK